MALVYKSTQTAKVDTQVNGTLTKRLAKAKWFMQMAVSIGAVSLTEWNMATVTTFGPKTQLYPMLKQAIFMLETGNKD